MKRSVALHTSCRGWLAAVAICLGGCTGAVVQRAAEPSPLARALALREAGRLDEACTQLEALAARGDRETLLQWAETLMLRGRHREAVQKLRRAWDEDPQSPPLVYTMARALDGAGLPEEAIVAYARHLKTSPRDSAMALRLTELLIGQGDAAGASAVAEAALQIAPEHAGLHVALARALLVRGRLPAARSHAEQATRLAATDPQAWWQLAQVHMMDGELEKARDVLEKVLAVEPMHADAMRDLGVLWVELGDAARGAGLLERSKAIAADNPNTWLALGVARHRLRELDKAMAALEQAQQLAPKAAQVYVAMADVALDQGLPRRAQLEARRARERLGRDQAADLRGRVEQQLLRSVVVAVMADALCRGTRDEAQVQAAMASALRDEGLEQFGGQAVQVAANATPVIRAAQARCQPPKPAPAAGAGGQP